MAKKIDFYYSKAQAESNIEKSQILSLPIPKRSYRGKIYTESVPTNTLPTCGIADSEFIGSGFIESAHIVGYWGDGGGDE